MGPTFRDRKRAAPAHFPAVQGAAVVNLGLDASFGKLGDDAVTLRRPDDEEVFSVDDPWRRRWQRQARFERGPIARPRGGGSACWATSR